MSWKSHDIITKENALNDLKAGLPIKQILKNYKIGRTTLHIWRKEAKIKKRENWSRNAPQAS